jgi:hypothetical protein
MMTIKNCGQQRIAKGMGDGEPLFFSCPRPAGSLGARQGRNTSSFVSELPDTPTVCFPAVNAGRNKIDANYRTNDKTISGE